MRQQRSSWKTSFLKWDSLSASGNALFWMDVSPVYCLHCAPLFPTTRHGEPYLFFVRRLVYDRETGKPKGYGFCEYQDQETALSAMRNLNGREFSGRALRVDNAASEKNKEELKSRRLFPRVITCCCFRLKRWMLLSYACGLLLSHRFGNGGADHWVSLWGQHPAAGSPRVHQQSCGQSSPRADVWTYEADEGGLLCCCLLGLRASTFRQSTRIELFYKVIVCLMVEQHLNRPLPSEQN